MTSGTIFDIQRFCTHDGPGIRTVVFLKGCPLDCAWCHNPESKRSHPELFYTPRLCIGCGKCAAVCPESAHSMNDEGHTFERTLCRECMVCAEGCFARALEVAGREIAPEEALIEVAKDIVFYEESGGGLTLSGGEPMAQFEFTRAILEGAKGAVPPSFDTRSRERTQDWTVSIPGRPSIHAQRPTQDWTVLSPEPEPSALSVRSGGCIEGRPAKLHTCIETCGFGASAQFLEIVPLVDLFLWDIKDTDEARHEANTGVPLSPILENLRLVDEAGGVTILRCPLIANVNLTEEHLDGIAAVFHSLRNSRGIELLLYHPLGDSKYARLGIQRALDPFREPSAEEMTAAKAYLLTEHGIKAL